MYVFSGKGRGTVNGVPMMPDRVYKLDSTLGVVANLLAGGSVEALPTVDVANARALLNDSIIINLDANGVQSTTAVS